MATPKISLHGVTKSFGPKKVLQGIDLDVAKGESMVVIGGSGSGKSVLLKCILGLLTPDAGSIKIDGVEVVGLSEGEREQINRKFGMLFQSAALFDSLRVWENVAFGLIRAQGMSRREAKPLAGSAAAASTDVRVSPAGASLRSRVILRSAGHAGAVPEMMPVMGNPDATPKVLQ